MTWLTIPALIAFAIALSRLLARVRRLEREVAELRGRSGGRATIPAAAMQVAMDAVPAAADPEAARAPGPPPSPPTSLDRTPAIEPPQAEPAPLPIPPRPSREPLRLRFETIVGGNLPIWIGGAALVLSAFFLVRYSIENALLGPTARTVIAALFALALLAASELARRLPATREDPRVAQVLAGAGVASLYGTLYIAAALYHLIGAGSAFAAMIVVTLAALGLALRHGPPTAIMALIGGFIAPLLSSFDAQNVGPLLVYLGLLVAALFGLAIRRGWAWLALAACGGGFAWVNILAAAISRDGLSGVGAFIVLLAVGATMALPRTGAERPLLRLLPMVAGLIQLLILAPALDFGPLAWGLYLLLSASALWLGWRDAALAPGAAAALVAVLALLALSLVDDHTGSAPLAAIGITLLFGVPGHLLARRGSLWAGIALGSTAGPVLLAEAIDHGLLTPPAWAGLLALAAVAAATLSWRSRERAREASRPTMGLTGGAAVAAMLLAVAMHEVVPTPWLWPAWLILGVGLAAWSARTQDLTISWLAALPLAAMVIGLAIEARSGAYFRSILLTSPSPGLTDLIATGLLPAGLVAATAWLLPPGRTRTVLAWIALGLALAFIPAALPAPWHTPGLAAATAALLLYRPAPRIWAAAAGMATLLAAIPLLAVLAWTAGLSLTGDRLPWLTLPPLATILRELTFSAALIGVATVRAAPSQPWRSRIWALLACAGAISIYALAKAPLAIGDPARFQTLGLMERVAITQIFFACAWIAARYRPRIAQALLMLALFRFAWFDLLILNPAFVAQSAGSIPVFNLAVLDAALVALWLRPYRRHRLGGLAMLAAVLVAVCAAVRQATHGDLLTGSIGRTENWLYSAALLGLALAWLSQGIRRALGDLRVAGLCLLVLVTLKVFLIDAAVLEGLLRILSFLGLGIALIAIGWAYRRFVADQSRTT